MQGHELEVWMDTRFLGQTPIKVGFLKHDRGHIRFNYDEEWLKLPSSFDIDPDLTLDHSVFHPDPAKGNFGVFLDSSPDRWGQTLMKRREAMEAKDGGRKAKIFYAWDYLIGVQDQTRQGALRFKYPGTEVFLSSHQLSAPPAIQLAELESIALELTSKKIDDLDRLRNWLSVLVAPGSSLGGARPKANFTQTDGTLWIAKFPSKDDQRDMGAWEMLAYTLAKKAKIELPNAKLLHLGQSHRTFSVQRFDRLNHQRNHYASAMTMLKQTNSDESSYLDIAQFIMLRGARGFVKEDLVQLFRRVVFNLATSNRDDHLRNHGFILDVSGWRLSPAFDINPTIEKAEHTLSLDVSDHLPSLDSLISTAEYYELTIDEANTIAQEIIQIVKAWESLAQKLKIAKGDIELMRPAFMTDWEPH
jgi:serine/threonine-protein kinase HipA